MARVITTANELNDNDSVSPIFASQELNWTTTDIIASYPPITNDINGKTNDSKLPASNTTNATDAIGIKIKFAGILISETYPK